MSSPIGSSTGTGCWEAFQMPVVVQRMGPEMSEIHVVQRSVGIESPVGSVTTAAAAIAIDDPVTCTSGDIKIQGKILSGSIWSHCGSIELDGCTVSGGATIFAEKEVVLKNCILQRGDITSNTEWIKVVDCKGISSIFARKDIDIEKIEKSVGDFGWVRSLEGKVTAIECVGMNSITAREEIVLEKCVFRYGELQSINSGITATDCKGIQSISSYGSIDLKNILVRDVVTSSHGSIALINCNADAAHAYKDLYLEDSTVPLDKATSEIGIIRQHTSKPQTCDVRLDHESAAK